MFKISGKNLAELNMEGVCHSCFKLKITLESQFPIEKKKIPFQMPFPGVFSSFDAHTKNVVKTYSNKYGKVPIWFPDLGKKIVTVENPPGWQRFNAEFPDFNIFMTGAIDAVFKLEDGSFLIGDYKTASFTETQDMLLPLYTAQLHAYKTISEMKDFFKPVTRLALIYTEPLSYSPGTEKENYTLEDFEKNFLINFRLVAKPIEVIPQLTESLLHKLRAILDNPNPIGLPTCSNCELRKRLFNHETQLKEIPVN